MAEWQETAQHMGMCPCARTREYCRTVGCKRDEQEWRYTTEGREKDHLRRIIDRRMRNRPVSRWVRPERAVTHAWLLNMERQQSGALFIEKFGSPSFVVEGVP